jgi:hypothetical protein
MVQVRPVLQCMLRYKHIQSSDMRNGQSAISVTKVTL